MNPFEKIMQKKFDDNPTRGKMKKDYFAQLAEWQNECKAKLLRVWSNIVPTLFDWDIPCEFVSEGGIWVINIYLERKYQIWYEKNANEEGYCSDFAPRQGHEEGIYILLSNHIFK